MSDGDVREETIPADADECQINKILNNLFGNDAWLGYQ